MNNKMARYTWLQYTHRAQLEKLGQNICCLYIIIEPLLRVKLHYFPSRDQVQDPLDGFSCLTEHKLTSQREFVYCIGYYLNEFNLSRLSVSLPLYIYGLSLYFGVSSQELLTTILAFSCDRVLIGAVT